MSNDRKKCLDAGCDDYATKPIDLISALLAYPRIEPIVTVISKKSDFLGFFSLRRFRYLVAQHSDAQTAQATKLVLCNELKAIRRCLKKGYPYGNDRFVSQVFLYNRVPLFSISE